MDIWMKVSDDEYELPELVADTQAELARLCGVQRASIASALVKARKSGWRSTYAHVHIEEDDYDS